MRKANWMLAQFHFKSSSVIRCSSGKAKYQPPDGRRFTTDQNAIEGHSASDLQVKYSAAYNNPRGAH